MAEKSGYYERVRDCYDNPDIILSVIGDGMSQGHCEIPYLSNLQTFTKKLNQHLQGMLEHGSPRLLTLFRTFNNVKNGANLNIFCFLHRLEAWFERRGRFPEKIYWQVDGGCENANKFCIALCELLVANGMARQVIFTRLPVGHTHEDIDGRFGTLWNHFKNKPIWTVDKFAERCLSAFQDGAENVKVIDVNVVPDYVQFLEKSVDPHFANWAKEQDTMLQFKFESVDTSSSFPLGCRTQFRKYCSETYVELGKPTN